MKYYNYFFTIMFVLFTQTLCANEILDLVINNYQIGDTNQDYEINVLDINIIINYIIANISLDSLDFSISDMNVDGIINVIDIVDIVNIILDS